MFFLSSMFLLQMPIYYICIQKGKKNHTPTPTLNSKRHVTTKDHYYYHRGRTTTDEQRAVDDDVSACDIAQRPFVRPFCGPAAVVVVVAFVVTWRLGVKVGVGVWFFFPF